MEVRFPTLCFASFESCSSGLTTCVATGDSLLIKEADMSNGAATSFQPSQAQQQDAVLVPAGLIGSIVGALAPIVGQKVGGTAGNVISTAGQFAHLIPFNAGAQTVGTA